MKSIIKFNVKNIIIWPNADVNEEIAKQIRIFREKGKLQNYKIVKNLPIDFTYL